MNKNHVIVLLTATSIVEGVFLIRGSDSVPPLVSPVAIAPSVSSNAPTHFRTGTIPQLAKPNRTEPSTSTTRPTSLADVPKLEAALANDPQGRYNFDYLIGLRSRIDGCVGSRIPAGVVQLVLHFDNDPQTHEAVAHGYDFSPRGTTISEMEQRILSSCLRQEHDSQPFTTDETWGKGNQYGLATTMTFPADNDRLYRVIASGDPWAK